MGKETVSEMGSNAFLRAGAGWLLSLMMSSQSSCMSLVPTPAFWPLNAVHTSEPWLVSPSSLDQWEEDVRRHSVGGVPGRLAPEGQSSQRGPNSAHRGSGMTFH